MKEQTILSQQLTVTFIHCDDRSCHNCQKKQKTFHWLEQILNSGKWEEVPPVIIVKDAESEQLLVYDGNVRTNFATLKKLNLRAVIITDQNELNDYFKDHSVLWFGIKDFRELLEYMRIYANYPRDDRFKEMPAELIKKIKEKSWQYEEECRKERNRFFGWYNDD